MIKEALVHLIKNYVHMNTYTRATNMIDDPYFVEGLRLCCMCA